jgi:pimeloyl-ACP methyl ester carboxylesterase
MTWTNLPTTKKTGVLIFLAMLLLAASAAGQTIDSNNTFATFDLSIQSQATISLNQPVFSASINTTTTTLQFNRATKNFHVQAGYDFNGQFMLDMASTDPASDPTFTQANGISRIQIVNGNLVVFDASGSQMPVVLPRNAPLPSPLALLSPIQGASLLSGLVISNPAVMAQNMGATLQYYNGGTGALNAQLTTPMSHGQTGSCSWTYQLTTMGWTLSQVSINPDPTTAGSGSHTIQITNLFYNVSGSAGGSLSPSSTLRNSSTNPSYFTLPALESAGTPPQVQPQIQAAAGPNVLFQHGIFSNRDTWGQRMVPWLAGDFQFGLIYGYNLHSTNALHDQGTELINDLDSDRVNNFLMIGHSQGGLIARDVARRRSDLARGVITVDTPNAGARIDLTGRVAIADGLSKLIDKLAAGCGSPFDDPGCFLAYLTANLSYPAIDFGFDTAIPSSADLKPGSPYLNSLNGPGENFTRVGIQGNSTKRWLLPRLMGDAFCFPDDACGGRALYTYTQIAYASFRACEVVAILFDDPDTADVCAYIGDRMDDIDDYWNNLVSASGETSDGIVQGSSQVYSGATANYPISDADSHVGATKSDKVRTALSQTLDRQFLVPRKGSSAQLSVAVNGSGSVTSNPAGINCGPTCAAIFNLNTTVTLTATPSAGYVFAGWSGACSGVSSCTIVMSSSNSVTASFSQSVNANSLVAHWKFDEGSGSTAVDSSGNGVNASIFGPAWSNAGPLGVALQFNGVSDYVGATVKLPQTEYTFMAWFQTTAANGAIMSVVDPVSPNAGAHDRHLGLQGGRVCHRVWSEETYCSTGAYNDNVWHLAAVTVGGTGGHLYVDGVLVAIGNKTSSDFTWQTGVVIGNHVSYGAFAGAISDVRIYNRVLDPSEISSAYTASSTLTVTLTGSGAGTVVSNPAGINCGGACSSSFTTGTSVTLTATPAAGSTFTGWSGSGCSGTGSCTLSVTARPRNVTANFDALPAEGLSVSKSGSGSGLVSSSSGGIYCGASCSAMFNYGTVVTLTASPDAGSAFSGWSGGGCSGTGTCTVQLYQAMSVSATFNVIPTTVTLSVSKAGSGSGTVNSSSGNISCGKTCSATVATGTSITLNAVPDTGSYFAGWSGGGCSGTGSCYVSPNAATSVVASFNASNPGGIVGHWAFDEGGGSTAVDSSGSGVNGTIYGPVATPGRLGWALQFNGATDYVGITINVPETEYTFAAWFQTTSANGAIMAVVDPVGPNAGAYDRLLGLQGGRVCHRVWSEETYCSGATFNDGLWHLASVTVGSGGGKLYVDGVQVATGNKTSSDFTWQTGVVIGNHVSYGAFAGAIDDVQIYNRVLSASEITSLYAAPANLSVTRNGGGGGTVVSNYAGINCGSACSANFAGGTSVTLTATPDANSTFAGWSGAGCSGTGSCTVRLSQNAAVTATFNQLATNQTLSISKSGSGTGTVSSSPGGIWCGATCSASFSNGVYVTLNASPDAGSTFVGWSGGGCYGTGSCTVFMNTAQYVTAVFNVAPPVITAITDSSYSYTIYTTSTIVIWGSNFSSGGSNTVQFQRPGYGDVWLYQGDGHYYWDYATSQINANLDGRLAAGWWTATVRNASGAPSGGFNVLINGVMQTLTVSKNGTGSGTVSSNTGSIWCGYTCTASFASGTYVTLTASPDAGSTFAGWSGGGCYGTGSCTVSMTSSQWVTATFNPAGPVVTAVTDGSYSSTLYTWSTIIIWGSNFSPGGNNTAQLQRYGFPDVWLYQGDGHYYWDYSANQINSTLDYRLASGWWTVTVRNANGVPSAPFYIYIN